ncbi:MAG: transporter [Rhizobium sp.]|nr:MAG: transporter [Rhizobium sp.]
MDGLPPIRLLIALDDGRDRAVNGELLIARIAPAYYLFKDHPAEVVLATPKGGYPALSAPLHHPLHQGLIAQRFLSDRNARDDLAETLGIDQIVIDDFDAAFCIGISTDLHPSESHGFMPTVRSFLKSGKPVAIVTGGMSTLSLESTMNGLLVVGDNAESSLLAAHALLKVAVARREIVSRPA